ncbi:unnamed protein product [Mesocestoides corti]|uniref:C2H2-type domain-containing protein n=1 Tax=Mesocestoides corti TaxID=53468 RepID=A0A0R3UFE4_MESCO|nr:unnamed protein product [Mesocestoides corti]
MHHSRISYIHPKSSTAPDPVLSPYADVDVLTGKRPWPAVNVEVVEKEPTICVICGVDFKTRSLAYFKEIKTPEGQTVDPTASFVCLYDPDKMESSSWIDAISKQSKDSQTSNDEKEDTGGLPRAQARELCYRTFQNLSEYTAHIQCYHSIIPHARYMGKKLNTSELKRLNAIKSRIPGPTIRELMGGAALGVSGNTDADHSNSSGKQKKGMAVEPRSMATDGDLNESVISSRGICRVCQSDFVDDDGLEKHLADFHIPEAQKRVQHLANVGELTGILDVDKLCTECFTIFSTVYKLQVHIMVSHGGKSWCTCGTCEQRFCETSQCLPANLTVGQPLESTDDDNQNTSMVPNEDEHTAPKPSSTERQSPTTVGVDSLYEPYEAKLPILTLCRIVDCHESKHCANLQPAVTIPFLPLGLVTQLLKSRGHQGKQVFDWLAKASDQPLFSDIDPFVYDDPNETKRGASTNKYKVIPGEDPLLRENVEIGQRLLGALNSRKISLSRNVNSEFESESARDKKEPGLVEERRDSRTSNPRGSMSTEMAAAGQKSCLPNQLIKLFTQIGERVVEMRQEKEFIEML